MREGDTIVALGTPSGRGALAVIRMSGPGAFAIFGRCVRSGGRFLRAPERWVGLYTVVDPETGVALDRGTAVKFMGPRSYTGQDMVEATTHGGIATPERVLQALRRAGARNAAPGEFTRRAVAAGKMDLLDAEGMGLMVDSADVVGHQRAVQGFLGGHRRFVEGLRARLEEQLAELEGEIEFGVCGSGVENARRVVGAVVNEVRSEIRGSDLGLGAAVPSVVIVGEQNAGKSTLFNTLVGTDRAIVDDKGGTTRDFLRERVSFGGRACELVDTAGFGEKRGRVDELAVARTWELAEAAWGVVLVSSACVDDLSADEVRLMGACREKGVVAVVSKTDLCAGALKREALGKHGVAAAWGDLRAASGRSEVRAALERVVGGWRVDGEEMMAGLWGSRQVCVLREILSIGDEMLGDCRGMHGVDGWAYGVRRMLEGLGDLSGTERHVEVLNDVLSRFCVGK